MTRRAMARRVFTITTLPVSFGPFFIKGKDAEKQTALHYDSARPLCFLYSHITRFFCPFFIKGKDGKSKRLCTTTLQGRFVFCIPILPVSFGPFLYERKGRGKRATGTAACGGRRPESPRRSWRPAAAQGQNNTCPYRYGWKGCPAGSHRGAPGAGWRRGEKFPR